MAGVCYLKKIAIPQLRIMKFLGNPPKLLLFGKGVFTNVPVNNSHSGQGDNIEKCCAECTIHWCITILETSQIMT